MSDHLAKIEWARGDAEFTYQTYPRAHTVRFANGHTVMASAAPGYEGDTDSGGSKVDPEAMLVGAVASCHMLTFLALAAKKRLVVESYTDDASGVLGRVGNESGGTRMAVTAITLRPKIVFGGENRPDEDTVTAMHEKSHHHCFIANTVNCAITVEPA
ncbi:MAG: OsmC family protein [Planctomycetota bacterium]